MRLNRIAAVGVAAVAATVLVAPGIAQALDLSGKTVTWIVPFKEGGGSDTLARLLAPYLQKELPGNPSIVILNQPGGGSIKASNKFHRTGKTDGTELFIASSSTFLPVTLQSKRSNTTPMNGAISWAFPAAQSFTPTRQRSKSKVMAQT